MKVEEMKEEKKKALIIEETAEEGSVSRKQKIQLSSKLISHQKYLNHVYMQGSTS